MTLHYPFAHTFPTAEHRLYSHMIYDYAATAQGIPVYTSSLKCHKHAHHLCRFTRIRTDSLPIVLDSMFPFILREINQLILSIPLCVYYTRHQILLQVLLLYGLSYVHFHW